MSAMTDVRFQAPLAVFPVKKWKNTRWRSIKAALHLGKTSMDQASFHMLSLYRANLEIRLRAIDESSLLSDSQKKSYSMIAEMLKPSTNGSAAARNFEWDEIYKAESLIALLFSGAQLRQEIGTRLKDLAKDNPADADALARDYQLLLKPSGEGPNPGRTIPCCACFCCASWKHSIGTPRRSIWLGQFAKRPTAYSGVCCCRLRWRHLRPAQLGFFRGQQMVVAVRALDRADGRIARRILQPAHWSSTPMGRYVAR